MLVFSLEVQQAFVSKLSRNSTNSSYQTKYVCKDTQTATTTKKQNKTYECKILSLLNDDGNDKHVSKGRTCADYELKDV